jgi:hypothetical protein
VRAQSRAQSRARGRRPLTKGKGVGEYEGETPYSHPTRTAYDRITFAPRSPSTGSASGTPDALPHLL